MKRSLANLYFPASHSLKSPDRSVLEIDSSVQGGFSVIFILDLLYEIIFSMA